MKIYIASRYSRRKEMEGYADTLSDLGHEITATWVYGGEEGLTREDIAILDYKDVRRAQAVLSFTEPHGSWNPAGARHTEFGWGYEMGKKCFIVGEKEIVFHHLPGVIQFNTFEEARNYFATNHIEGT